MMLVTRLQRVPLMVFDMLTRHTRTAVIIVVALLAAGCDRDNDPASNTSTAAASGTPHNGAFSEPDLLKLQQDDGQWVMAARNYASTRR
jgi:hypothetical protein